MIPTANGGVNYLRMAQWAFQMRKYRGVEVALYCFQYDMNLVHPWQRDIMSVPDIRRHIESLHKIADVVIWQPVHYEHTLAFFNELRQRYGKLTLVEMDDNYLDVPASNEAFHSFGPNSYNRRIALECMRMADGLIVSTPHLKGLYSQFNENIHVVENSLDFKGDSSSVGWDNVSVRKHKGTRIGWIGGRSHFDDLMLVAPVLKKILMSRPEVSLCFVNSAVKETCKALRRPYPFEGLKNVQIADNSVPINRYPRFMAHFGFDIGLAPLVDNNFNRSKSNLRWLEYAALKIPCIASDISHFTQTIDHLQTGVLVAGNDLGLWERHILALIDNPRLRESIGRNAYNRVKKDFNVKKNAANYFRLLKTLLKTTVGEELVEVA